jgi:hypothetical protein
MTPEKYEQELLDLCIGHGLNASQFQDFRNLFRQYLLKQSLSFGEIATQEHKPPCTWNEQMMGNVENGDIITCSCRRK